MALFAARVGGHAQLFEEARHLPTADRDWLIANLIGDQGAMSDEAFDAWQRGHARYCTDSSLRARSKEEEIERKRMNLISIMLIATNRPYS
ncbi:MAG: hypothetical protein KGL37_08275, partial [Acidobacteriota bacterium]|nr:hypothetical protein [Acidobacteriota bacterium]